MVVVLLCLADYGGPFFAGLIQKSIFAPHLPFMKNLTRIFLLLILLCGSVLTYAQQAAESTSTSNQPVKVQGLIGAALELGGESVAEVLFTNGDTQKMPAGQGGTFFVGAQLSFAGMPNFRIRGSAGIKYLTTAADNAHIRLTRFPLILALNYRLVKDFTLAAGVSSHRSINLKTDGIGQDVKFDPASGVFVELAYKGIGLSYVPMSYTAPDGKNYKATSVGLTFTGVFPKE